MSIENIILWYEKNVNYKLTKTFLDFLIKMRIGEVLALNYNEDIDLDFLNLYLLERNEKDFVFENGKYKIKKNRIPVISKFKEEPIKKVETKKEIIVKPPVEKLIPAEKKSNKKFKIEKLEGKKFKLVKL